jgi:regulation of enolase protein 1 (concanavalin A-like superfamily)
MRIASRISATILLAVALSSAVPAHAQTPPRPAVSLQRVPSISQNAIPVDVDGDGRPDIVGFSEASGLVVAHGNGDGTFGEPRALNRQATPLAVADFNDDGFGDIVAAEFAPRPNNGLATLLILRGRGDGTFAAAQTIATDVALNWENIVPTAVAQDLNADGKRDLAVTDRGVLVIYPGRGDLTFDQRYELSPAGDGAREITAGDVNHDNRPDLIAVSISNTVEVYLNQGGFVFRVNSIVLGTYDQSDVVAADLDGDGFDDLVIATSYWGLDFTDGQVTVLMSRGDGTFAEPRVSQTGVKGSVVVAVGDFNADGIPDIATGNRSWRYYDSACTGMVYWDSVSIFPGLGAGYVGIPATFRLGTTNGDEEPYRNTINAVWAADLNGDSRMDLLTSPGAAVLNRPATANRPPAVTAGPDQTRVSGSEVLFDALATDPDFDWLELTWVDESGANVPYPISCGIADPGEYFVTVSDRRGGVDSDSFVLYPPLPEGVYLFMGAITNTVGTQSPYTVRWSAENLVGATSLRLLSSSNDGQTFTPISGCTSLPVTATECAWTSPGPVTSTGRLRIEARDASGNVLYFSASERFRIISGPSISLPPGWSAADVGAVGAQGSSTSNGSTFTVRGSGSDVWNNADEFHWAFVRASHDFSITARVASVQNVNAWTKAGVMIREDLLTSPAGARHASMFVTPSTVKGTAFQRRVTADGASVSTAGPVATAPYWVRLTRTGNTITAYTRADGAPSWTMVGSQTYTDLPDSLLAGLVVSSHVDGTLATATFDHVEVLPDQISDPNYAEEDVGNVGAEGSATLNGINGTVSGSGADIWGTADEFHWLFRHANGDFSIQTQVTSVQNVNAWTKAGLMIRASSAAGSQHASLFATPSATKGIAFQVRQTTNGVSTQITQQPVAPKVWLRLTRQGSFIRAYFRKEQTDAWVSLGSVTLTGLPDTVEVGFVVSSHVDGTVATAAFSLLEIEPLRTWTTTQIGPGASDSSVDGTVFRVNNRGADIWGTSDAFTFTWTKWTGNGGLTVRVDSLDQADPWTKGGLMFRESLNPGSKYAFALVSALKGLALQYRQSTGGSSGSAGTASGQAPTWIKIGRNNDVFTMYVLASSSGWESIGQVSIAMPQELYVGLAVTSHNPGAAAWGSFDELTVRGDAFAGPEPVPTGP